jgi:glycosyltransferase involved in cell wall biosynthesis
MMEVVTPAKGSDAILYSIVIPVYNEAAVLPALYDRLMRVMEGLVEAL